MKFLSQGLECQARGERADVASDLRGAEVGTATNDKSGQVGSEDSGQRVPDK